MWRSTSENQYPETCLLKSGKGTVKKDSTALGKISGPKVCPVLGKLEALLQLYFVIFYVIVI